MRETRLHEVRDFESLRKFSPSPVQVAFLAVLLSVLFVGARLAIAAEGDVSRFVVAGTAFVDPATVTPHIHVFDGDGYDGQFYWRLSVNPTELRSDAVNGASLDQSLRATRIGYPALAWVLSAGQSGLAVWTLVLINLIAVGVIAGFAAAFSNCRHRPPLTGLVVAASSGLIMSLSRDLCEVVMVASVVAGVYFLSRRRPVTAAFAWSAAVLVHEQALVVVLAYGAYRVVSFLRERSRSLSAEELAWLLPVSIFVGWQIVCFYLLGTVPILGSRGASVGLPFVGLAPELARWVSGGMAKQEALIFPQLALTAGTTIYAFGSTKEIKGSDRWIVVALSTAVMLTVSLSQNVWTGPAELRQIVLVPTLAWLVIIASPRAVPKSLFAATALVWLATAGLRVLAI